MERQSMEQYSLVPNDFKDKDPRQLVYLYPTSLNVVAYAKRMQEFSFYQALEVAEVLAHRQGFVLLPWSCMHWQRAKNFGSDRKIKVGRNSFFLMKVEEMTKVEKRKLETYIQEELDREIKIS
jgi:hypothetical protein